MRDGEQQPFGLRVWDDTKRIAKQPGRGSPNALDPQARWGAGWIASVGPQKSRWFNIRVWGSWRLAFVLARLQMEAWQAHGHMPQRIERPATSGPAKNSRRGPAVVAVRAWGRSSKREGSDRPAGGLELSEKAEKKARKAEKKAKKEKRSKDKKVIKKEKKSQKNGLSKTERAQGSEGGAPGVAALLGAKIAAKPEAVSRIEELPAKRKSIVQQLGAQSRRGHVADQPGSATESGIFDQGASPAPPRLGQLAPRDDEDLEDLE